MKNFRPDESQENVDDIHRLLGRCVFSFSQFVDTMGEGILSRVADHTETRQVVTSMIGSMMADQVRAQFFAATAVGRGVTTDEGKIRSNLNKRCQDLIQRRNDHAHGTWYVTASHAREFREGLEFSYTLDPMLIRSRTSLRGWTFDQTVDSRTTLDEFANDADELTRLIWAYVSGLTEDPHWPGVMDRLGWEGNTVVELDLTDWQPPTA